MQRVVARWGAGSDLSAGAGSGCRCGEVREAMAKGVPCRVVVRWGRSAKECGGAWPSFGEEGPGSRGFGSSRGGAASAACWFVPIRIALEKPVGNGASCVDRIAPDASSRRGSNRTAWGPNSRAAMVRGGSRGCSLSRRQELPSRRTGWSSGGDEGRRIRTQVVGTAGSAGACERSGSRSGASSCRRRDRVRVAVRCGVGRSD